MKIKKRVVDTLLAGVPGFEPGNGGTKTRCLTTWLYPKDSDILARDLEFVNYLY